MYKQHSICITNYIMHCSWCSPAKCLPDWRRGQHTDCAEPGWIHWKWHGPCRFVFVILAQCKPSHTQHKTLVYWNISFTDDLFDEEGIRGPNIGKKLDKMTRSRKGRLPLVIEPGKKRPSSVMIAAKFATECNIAVRQYMPIFPHWKEYKEDSSIPIILGYIDRVCVSVQTCLFTLFIFNHYIVYSISSTNNVVNCSPSLKRIKIQFMWKEHVWLCWRKLFASSAIS